MSPDRPYNILYLPYNGIHEERLINNLKRAFPSNWNLMVVSELENVEIFRLVSISSDINQMRRVKLINELKRVKPDLVLVSMDWHPYTRQLIELANLLKIPTMIIVDEPYFGHDGDKWYSLKGFYSEEEAIKVLESGIVEELYNIPCASFVCCQNLQQSLELKKRGCNSNLLVTGHPVFDWCKNQTTHITSQSLLSRLPFPVEKKLLTIYLSKPVSLSFDKKTYLKSIKRRVNEIIDYASLNDAFVILKCAEYSALSELDIWDKLWYYKKNNFLYIDGELEKETLFDSQELIQASDVNLITPDNLLFVQSILLNKHTFIPFGPVENGFLGELNLTDLTVLSLVIGSKVNYSESFIQNVLVKLLPATFDNLNSHRIKLAMDFAIQYGVALKQRERELINIFNTELPQLFDPLLECKKEFNNNFNDFIVSKTLR